MMIELAEKHRRDRGLLALLLVLMVWSGIAPADRTVWMVESVWSVGLLAVLLVTRKWFKFSNAAYLCFWGWAVLQTIGAHYTFERVPMDWLMSPLDLTRNPYDRILGKAKNASDRGNPRITARSVNMKTEFGVLHCVLSMLLCAALVGCRGSDVVMYDARSGDVVWGSAGTDTDWRECLSLSVDGKNGRFYTLQTVNRDSKAKKAKLKLRAYDFTGVAHDEFVFDSDITYIGQDSFVISGGGLYRWEYIHREDVFYGKSPADPSERIICRVTNLDHMELRRYDPVTGTFVRIELSGDWCGETTSHHFDYCNGGVIVLARHGPIDITHYSGDVPIRGQKGDGNGIFRISHDGSVTEIFRENDKRANRLKLVSGWSRTGFAARTGNGDVRIFDKDCHEVQHVQLSQSHAEFVKDPFACVYEWIDDATIACYRKRNEDNDAVVLTIDAHTGKVREAVRSEFNLAGEYRVRLKDSLILKERF